MSCFDYDVVMGAGVGAKEQRANLRYLPYVWKASNRQLGELIVKRDRGLDFCATPQPIENTVA